MYNRLNPLGATLSRSPMVSLIFPSLKDKKRMFQDESKKKQAQRATTAYYVPGKELERIVERESLKRRDTTGSQFR